MRPPFLKKKLKKIVVLIKRCKILGCPRKLMQQKLAILIVACVVAMATVDPSDVCFTLLVP